MHDPLRSRFAQGRHAGVIAPLFSIPSRSSWGIGEIADLPLLARWLAAGGLDFVQLLPINEMQGGQSSPYSALSAMAIDPIFIAIEPMVDFRNAGGIEALGAEGQEQVAEVRSASQVQYRDRARPERSGPSCGVRPVPRERFPTRLGTLE